MTQRELFKETFSQLHASPDTLSEVMNMAKHENITYMNKTKRHPARKLIAIVAVAALLVTGAVAVSSGFLRGASAEPGGDFLTESFGVKGLEDTQPREIYYGAAGKSWTQPGTEWAPVDAETAAAIVGDNIVFIGKTYTMGDYNVTLDSYVMDDNGVGILTWTLSYPGGIPNVLYDENCGQFSFTAEDGLCEPALWTTEDEFVNSRNVLNTELSTADEFHIITYFGDAKAIVDDDLDMYLRLEERKWSEEKKHDFEVVNEGKILIEMGDVYLESVTLAGGEYTAHVSPLSIRFEAPFGEGAGWVPDDLRIQYVEGSEFGTEYVCEQDEPYMNNLIFGYYDGTMQTYENLVEVFNRLIDPAEVASATICGPNDTTLTFIPVQ